MAESFTQAFDQTPQVNTPQPDALPNVPFDVEFPEVTLRTIDFAMKKWFTNDQPIYTTNNFNQRRKIPILWSTEQRWSMMQKRQDVRDSKGQLILPLISIRRGSVDPIWERTAAVDIHGTANYKLYVHEYVNPTNGQKEYKLRNSQDKTVPIVEVIEIQAPKIVKVTYSVIFWSSSMQDLNVMIQHMIQHFHNKHTIQVSEHMYFSAFLDGISNDSNDASVQQDEYIYKNSFNIYVEAPLIEKDSIRRRRGIQGIKFKMKLMSQMDENEKMRLANELTPHDPYKLER